MEKQSIQDLGEMEIEEFPNDSFTASTQQIGLGLKEKIRAFVQRKKSGFGSSVSHRKSQVMDIQEVDECAFTLNVASRDVHQKHLIDQGDMIQLLDTNSRKDKYVTIGCDRGGHYRDKQNIPIEKRQRNTKTRLINCPFEIQGRREEDGLWKVVIKNDLHNHEASIDICGHPSARVLSKEEITNVDQMTRAGIAPKQILSSLRQRNPNLQAVSRNIYNVKGKIQRETLAGRSMIQVLYEELGNNGFTFDIKRDEVGHVTHLFFAHPTSIALSRSYSNVFVMDCTYKTNRYNMPLLEIIGVTSLTLHFFSSFAFLRSGGHEDYAWALSTFSKVLGPECQPLVIVTDRELALMKAIKYVFPKTTNLLCVWHIQKNIVANCKSSFEKKEDMDEFLSAWNLVVYSSTEDAFESAWLDLETSYKHKNDVLNYVRKIWLPHKTHFVSAWTEQCLHFGNCATSRAEGAHSKLKRYLLISTGDLRTVKEKMCLLISNDFQETKTKLSSERLTIPLNFNIPFFREVVTRISAFALQRLHEQLEKVRKNTMTTTCTGQFIATMGLPCAHTMNNWKKRVLSLDVIHSQWRIDTRSSLFSDNEINIEESSLEGIVSKFQDKYNQWPLFEKEDARAKLSQLASSSFPLLFEPNVQTSKGRPPNAKKRKVSISTRRDPSKFEIVEASRKCSKCKAPGHDIRTCPMKDRILSLDRNSSLVNGGGPINSIDLNMMPNLSNESFWDLEFEGID